MSDERVLADLWIPGKPRPKGRPRLGRGRKVFTPRETLEEEDRIEAFVNASDHLAVRDGYNVAISIDYSDEGQWLLVEEVADWKSSLQGDIDNYVKLTIDALQKTDLFKDDRQVMQLHASKQTKGWMPK